MTLGDVTTQYVGQFFTTAGTLLNPGQYTNNLNGTITYTPANVTPANVGGTSTTTVLLFGVILYMMFRK